MDFSYVEQYQMLHRAGLITTRDMVNQFKREGILAEGVSTASCIIGHIEKGLLPSYLRRKSKQISLLVDQWLFA